MFIAVRWAPAPLEERQEWSPPVCSCSADKRRRSLARRPAADFAVKERCSLLQHRQQNPKQRPCLASTCARLPEAEVQCPLHLRRGGRSPSDSKGRSP